TDGFACRRTRSTCRPRTGSGQFGTGIQQPRLPPLIENNGRRTTNPSDRDYHVYQTHLRAAGPLAAGFSRHQIPFPSLPWSKHSPNLSLLLLSLLTVSLSVPAPYTDDPSDE